MMSEHRKILLVDDDLDDQEIFSFALGNADQSARCDFANDGLHAINKLETDHSYLPDYIFIDMNMPRMNGQQCLRQIKKISRLSHVPVYMYSTSIDTVLVEENKKLGAVDFIVKPSDINSLTKILSGILKKQLVVVLLLATVLCFVSTRSVAQADSIPAVTELKKLSVEELMNIVVTSVSKVPEKLTEVASAIQVITGDEIKRSGAIRLPGALRLASNMEVISTGSHDVRVSARGFNGFPIANSSLANKLLVLIDGRTVYTPLFGGVYWDVQNVLQEDIKQIEVESGPGGTLWGANAVNGIVNIISKSARETQGVYAATAYGGTLRNYTAVRYGSHVDTTFFYKVYLQRHDINPSHLSNGGTGTDPWSLDQGGFRMDYIPSAKNNFTFQGDAYDGEEDDAPGTHVSGQNIIARWTYNCSGTSGLIVQTYFDHTFRKIRAAGTIDDLFTYDIDLQHNFLLGERNKIVWGLGCRLADDDIQTSQNSFVPEQRDLNLYSGFIQDQLAIVKEKLELTLGSKVLHNDYTDFEVQPTIRLAWTPNDVQTIWTAVSRAVRTPTRFDADLYSADTTGLSSVSDFKSEKLIAYELGYRMRPFKNVSFSLSTFYNEYTDLRSIDSNATPPPGFYFKNNLEAKTYGVELNANIIATRWWKIRGGYTYLDEKFKNTSPLTLADSRYFEAIDAKNQFLIQSMMDIGKHFQVDGLLRYMDVLPGAFTLPSVPSYLTFDLRLAWIHKWLTASVVGQNLTQKFRSSTGNIQIARNVYGKISISF